MFNQGCALETGDARSLKIWQYCLYVNLKINHQSKDLAASYHNSEAIALQSFRIATIIFFSGHFCCCVDILCIALLIIYKTTVSQLDMQPLRIFVLGHLGRRAMKFL